MSNQLHRSRLDSAGYDKIFVRNLSLLALVGVLPHERFAPRPVFVNLSFVCDVSQAAASDDLYDAVDYANVCEAVKIAVGQSSFRLIESLASCIADTVLTFSGVVEVTVTLDKPGAVEGCESVAVEITRRR